MSGFWLSRLVFQRGVGLIYLVAFVVALNQFCPLLGERGLLPVSNFIRQVPFRESPSLFYFLAKDSAFIAAAWFGILLSCLAVTGIADGYTTWFSMLVWTLLWVLYLSFVNVGQTFYGFGWESLLLETGFFTIFLGCRYASPDILMNWVLRWLEFRLMFGAGLIKLRGDPCWRDYTCLDYHYETQPMPNPVSWFIHWAPAWSHRLGVGFNHFSELIVPFGYFLPQPVSSIAAILTIVFQAGIMVSGNLSWLNLLTIVLAIPMLDDRLLGLVIPIRIPATVHPELTLKVAAAVVALLVAVLSINPIRNMISPRQVMNTSYNPLHIVDTYGAFGSITRTRYEIILEGTGDAALTPSTKWLAYEFRGKPGDTGRMPPLIAPYHLRLDWLMWFAAMSRYDEHPWFVHLVGKLLQGDAATLSLLKTNPFSQRAPQFVKAEIYEYHFTTPDERRRTGQWWKRTLAGSYFPAVSLETPAFHDLLAREGWL